MNVLLTSAVRFVEYNLGHCPKDWVTGLEAKGFRRRESATNHYKSTHDRLWRLAI